MPRHRKKKQQIDVEITKCSPGLYSFFLKTKQAHAWWMDKVSQSDDVHSSILVEGFDYAHEIVIAMQNDSLRVL